MINYHKEIVRELNKILPTYYEMFLYSGLDVPCISYMELSNMIESKGDTIEYSSIDYQIKVWATDIETIQENAIMVDNAMRTLGFKRIASVEMSDNNSSMIQKILTYSALAREEIL